jgi:hypothetical protein
LNAVRKSDNHSTTPSSTEALVAGPLPNVAHIGAALCEGSFRFETKRPSIEKEGRVIFLNVLRAMLNSVVASFTDKSSNAIAFPDRPIIIARIIQNCS